MCHARARARARAHTHTRARTHTRTHTHTHTHTHTLQSPDKHRSAIAELAQAAETRRGQCAALGSQAIDNDRKLEMVVKVCTTLQLYIVPPVCVLLVCAPGCVGDIMDSANTPSVRSHALLQFMYGGCGRPGAGGQHTTLRTIVQRPTHHHTYSLTHTYTHTHTHTVYTQFEKEVSRCIKLLEELDSVVAKKKDVSQQVGKSGTISAAARFCTVRAARTNTCHCIEPRCCVTARKKDCRSR